MRKDYLSSLSRAARWCLPPAEAAEVLEDYRDLIEQEPRSEEALRRDLGNPKDAVGQLVQVKAYRRWLKVFAALTVCALFPAVGPILSRLFWWNEIFWFTQLDWAYLLAGWVLSFLWFQRNGRKEDALPREIFLTMLVPLAGMVWCWYVALSAMYWQTQLYEFLSRNPMLGPSIHLVLLCDGFIMGLAGLFGLVRARMGDRRWRAVYVLGLAGAVLSMSVWALLSCMDLSFSDPNWQTPILVRYIAITVLGLVGTGASLC